MIIKHILKQIWRQKAANTWLWTEMVLITVCLWYITIYLYQYATIYYLPMGFDIENVYKVELGALSADSENFTTKSNEENMDDLITLISRIKHYPGVEYIGLSAHSSPYDQITWSGQYTVDTVPVHGERHRVSPGFFNVFGMTDINGDGVSLVEKASMSNTVIITERVQREFAEKGVMALNSPVKFYGQTVADKTIRAVIPDVRDHTFTHYYKTYYETLPEAGILDTKEKAKIFFRVDPGSDHSRFAADFHAGMKDILKIGNYYLQSICSMEQVKEIYYRQEGKRDDIKNKIAILFFLLINIFLAVIGTFWLRTQERKSEIALYLAMGSTYGGVAGRLFTEAFILLGFAFVPAVVISYYIMVTGTVTQYFMRDGLGGYDFTVTMSITFLILSLMLIAGIWFPSRQAMKVEPAIALRDE